MLQELIDSIKVALQSDLMIGGMALGAMWYIIGLLRYVPNLIRRLAKRHLVLSVEIRRGDDAFLALTSWMAAQPYTKRCKMIAVTTDKGEVDKTVFTPSPGAHFFKTSHCWVYFERERSVSQHNKDGYHETFHFMFMTRKRAVLETIMKEAEIERKKFLGSDIQIYVPKWSSWEPITNAVSRGFDTVIMPNGVKEQITSSIDRFQRNEEFYVSKGFPYRLGFLLTGSPGCGKTSLVRAVASHYKLPVYILNLSNRNMDDSSVLDLICDLPKRSILLMEDVDTIVPERKDDDDGVTLGGVLNALDGVATPDGRILFMSTNCPENLDEALIRPGRADFTFNIPNPTEDQITEYLNLHGLKEFSTPPKSMAEAQQMVIDQILMEK